MLGHAHTPAFDCSCIFLGWWKQTSQKEQSRAGDGLCLKVHQREYEPSVTSQKCGSRFLAHGGGWSEFDPQRCFSSKSGSSLENSFLVIYRDFLVFQMTKLGRTQNLTVPVQFVNKTTISKCGVKLRWIVKCGCRRREKFLDFREGHIHKYLCLAARCYLCVTSLIWNILQASCFNQY